MKEERCKRSRVLYRPRELGVQQTANLAPLWKVACFANAKVAQEMLRLGARRVALAVWQEALLAMVKDASSDAAVPHVASSTTLAAFASVEQQCKSSR